MDIGLAIKVKRVEASLRQDELAQRCSCSVAYISLLEHNKREVSLTMLQKISSALDIKLSELIQKAESYKFPTPERKKE